MMGTLPRLHVRGTRQPRGCVPSRPASGVQQPEARPLRIGVRIDDTVKSLLLWLAGCNRSPHEVLFGNDKDIPVDYESTFVGLTQVPCSLDTLPRSGDRVRYAVAQRLRARHRRFLRAMAAGAVPAPVLTARLALPASQPGDIPETTTDGPRPGRCPRHRPESAWARSLRKAVPLPTQFIPANGPCELADVETQTKFSFVRVSSW
jgi:hypothetical protein